MFIFYYKCNKINPNCGGSPIDSLDWIKKKPTTNSINKNYNKCFQYPATLALNHVEIGKHSERTTKFKPFIDKYNGEGLNYPSKKLLEKIQESIWQFLLMFCLLKKKKIYPACVSKHN